MLDVHLKEKLEQYGETSRIFHSIPWSKLQEDLVPYHDISQTFNHTLIEISSHRDFISELPAGFSHEECRTTAHVLIFRAILKKYESADVAEWSIVNGLRVNKTISKQMWAKVFQNTIDTSLKKLQLNDAQPFIIAHKLYQAKGNDYEEAVHVMCLLAKYGNQAKFVPILYDLCGEKLKEIRVLDLQKICHALFLSSKDPLITCIKIAGLFKHLSNIYLTDKEEYLRYYENFTQIALNLVNDFPSDQIATIFLEQTDELGNSPFSEGIRTENLMLFSNPRVSRICDMFWTSPRFLESHDDDGIRIANVFHLIESFAMTPFKFFTLPIGKFYLRALFYVGFLINFSYSIAYLSKTINQERIHQLPHLEILVYLQAVTFLFGEVGEMYKDGIIQHFRDIWNILDGFIYAFFVVLMICRWIISFYPLELINACSVTLALCPARVVYMTLVSILSVLMWTRLLYTVVVQSALGPLIRMIFKIFQDIINFAQVLFLVFMGFLFALYHLCKNEFWVVDGFETFTVAFTSVFEMLIGQVDFGQLYTAINNSAILAVIIFLYCIFILTGLIGKPPQKQF